MPYDPTPVDATRESLDVQVGAGRGEPERLYILGRPRHGIVEVREIVGGCAPREYQERADVLLERFERAQRDRRRINAELHLIRRWLDGLA
ncbi:MAG: hypothetical protein JO180_06425 [Gemmatirosa sp.]|nr:hypothetical protein [Gemmatirosa sp.]